MPDTIASTSPSGHPSPGSGDDPFLRLAEALELTVKLIVDSLLKLETGGGNGAPHESPDVAASDCPPR
jgi:hypothetical protein